MADKFSHLQKEEYLNLSIAKFMYEKLGLPILLCKNTQSVH